MPEADEATLVSIVKRVQVKQLPDGSIVEVGEWVESVEGQLTGEEAEREWARVIGEDK